MFRKSLAATPPRYPHAIFLAQEFFALGGQSIGRMSPLVKRIRTVQVTNFSVTIRQAGRVSLVDVCGRLTFFEVGALPEFPSEEAALQSFPQSRLNETL